MADIIWIIYGLLFLIGGLSPLWMPIALKWVLQMMREKEEDSE